MQTYAFFSIELTFNVILKYCKRQFLLLQTYFVLPKIAVVFNPFENALKSDLP